MAWWLSRRPRTVAGAGQSPWWTLMMKVAVMEQCTSATSLAVGGHAEDDDVGEAVAVVDAFPLPNWDAASTATG